MVRNTNGKIRGLWRLIFTGVFLLTCSQRITAQQDTLRLKNDNILVGELKNVQKGVATIETDYSDVDFKIKWKKVKTLNTRSEFLILTRKGRRYNGRLATADSTGVFVLSRRDTLARLPIEQVIYLNEANPGFLSNFSGSISLGYNFAKAQNLSELSVRSHLRYRARRWSLDAHYNDIRSTRKHAESVERLDASLNFQYYLQKNWFTVTEISFFSNTEQNIKLRTLGLLGIGKMIIHNNKMFWTGRAGITYNNENFNIIDQKDFQNSSEAFFGMTLNLYDVQDFSLLTKAVVYPSLTESGRWRFDYQLDLKYDLPLHFFIKLGLTYNFDNQPKAGASQSDYVFQTTLGWDFN